MPTFTGDDANNTVNGGAENDVIIGNGGSDTLSGGGGDDQIFSYTLDALFPGFLSPGISYDIFADIDRLNGGAGDDYMFAGYGDFVDGGTSSSFGDRLFISFQGATSGVQADFRILRSQGSITIGGGTITNIQNIGYLEGSDFDDFLVPIDTYYPSGGSVYGRGGNDHIIADYYGGWGGSGLHGGEGDDILDARPSQYGAATYGDAGNDTIYAAYNLSSAYGGDGDDTIYGSNNVFGGSGNDTIIVSDNFYGTTINGDDGNDHITASNSGGIYAGGAGSDVLIGGSGADTLVAGNYVSSFNGPPMSDDLGLEQDSLSGGGGDDVLAAGLGDNVDGGAGNDILRLSLAGYGTGVTFDTAGIVSGQPYVTGGGTIQNIETLERLRGTDFADTLTLATQASLLTVDAGGGNDFVESQGSSVSVNGGAGNNSFLSGAAGDIWDGGEGIDTILYRSATAGVTVNLSTSTGSGGDQLRNIENVVGSAFDDNLTGSASANDLRGGTGDDSLSGLAGNDTLDGGAGNDVMRGGLGNDVFVIDVDADRALEAAGEGYDTAFTRSSFALETGSEIEELRAADVDSTSAIDLTGNASNQILAGNAGANRLSGGGGNDYLQGNGGIDTLDGGTGNDVLRGGTGNDYYFIDAVGDRALESAGEGYDALFTSASFALEAGAEIEELRAADAVSAAALNLRGNEFSQVLAGNAGANVLSGGGGVDYLQGNGGNDTLDGGTGADVMLGGAGDDYYLIDTIADRMIETLGEGFDTAFTTVSLTLAADADIEALRAADATSTAALDLTGNGLGQILAGNAGANRLNGGGGDDYLEGRGGVDTLDGGTGNDVLRGGADNDYYLVDSIGDRILEAGGEGYDAVFTTVSFQLESGSEIEELRVADAGGVAAVNLLGNAFNQVLAGNAGANYLFGSGGDDHLEGRGGNDTLDGGSGNDVLRGGDGADVFQWTSIGGNDRILDFVRGTDRIDLSQLDAVAGSAGDQAFAFIGASAFSNVAGQLRSYSEDGIGFLAGDTDGNGIADFVIDLSAVQVDVTDILL